MVGLRATRDVLLVERVGLMPAALFLFLLPEVFTNYVWVGQVEVRCLENEVGAPDGEEPADPSEDQPWEDVRVMLVYVWWTWVGKSGLESPEVAIGGRDEVGFVSDDDDGGRNGGSENDNDGKY